MPERVPLPPPGFDDVSVEEKVSVQGPGQTSVPVMPRSAVQNVGNRQVVYLVNPKEPGKFVEREVRLGDAAGDKLTVLLD